MFELISKDRVINARNYHSRLPDVFFVIIVIRITFPQIVVAKFQINAFFLRDDDVLANLFKAGNHSEIGFVPIVATIVGKSFFHPHEANWSFFEVFLN